MMSDLWLVHTGGESSIWATTSDDFMHLGVGVTLYFKLLQYLALAMFVGSLFFLPAVVMFGSGARVPTSAPDPFKFSRITLGNVGYVWRVVVHSTFSRHVRELTVMCHLSQVFARAVSWPDVYSQR